MADSPASASTSSSNARNATRAETNRRNNGQRYIDGEFTLKRVRIEPDKILLIPANPKYRTIEISPDNEFAVWGVVSFVVKKV